MGCWLLFAASGAGGGMNNPESQRVVGSSMAADDSSFPLPADVEHLLASPFDGSPLRWNDREHVLQDSGGSHEFSLDTGIPCLFAPNEWSGRQADVTELVKQFYEKTPFPNYEDVDSRQSLKQKASVSVFARLVDEQLPRAATIFEAGCGTGQFTNFLGMAPGRTVIGGDANSRVLNPDDIKTYGNPQFFTENRPTRGGFPILCPFPNRIRAGQFTWEGRTYHPPIGDPANKSLEILWLKGGRYELHCAAELKGKLTSPLLRGLEFDLTEIQ